MKLCYSLSILNLLLLKYFLAYLGSSVKTTIDSLLDPQMLSETKTTNIQKLPWAVRRIVSALKKKKKQHCGETYFQLAFSYSFIKMYLTKKIELKNVTRRFDILKDHYQECREMISFKDVERKQLQTWQSPGSKIAISLQPVFTSMKLGNILKDKGAETEDRIWSKWAIICI